MTPNQGDPSDPRARQQRGTGQQPPGRSQSAPPHPQPPRAQPPQAQPPQAQPPQAQPPQSGSPQGPPQQGQPMQGQPMQGQSPQGQSSPTPQPPASQYGAPQGQPPQPRPPSGAQGMPTSGGAPGAQPQRMQQVSQPGAAGAQGGSQAPQRHTGRQSRGRSLLRPVSVDDVVAEDVVTVERDAPVREAVGEMRERDVGAVVVVEDDQPVGVLTDRTVALTLDGTQNVAETAVEELIEDDLISVDASTDIFETLQLMRDEGIRRLPVVDEEGTLQGIVTLDDALVLLGSELDKLATTVQEQSPRL